jgi:hypothetical protein
MMPLVCVCVCVVFSVSGMPVMDVYAIVAVGVYANVNACALVDGCALVDVALLGSLIDSFREENLILRQLLEGVGVQNVDELIVAKRSALSAGKEEG